MNTQELRQRMIDDLALIGYDLTEHEPPADAVWLDDFYNTYYFFDDIDNGKWDGSYYFVRDGLYHKGNIDRHQKEIYGSTTDLKDYLYYDYWSLSLGIGRDFARNVHLDGIAEDRIARVKGLELLKRIDDYYYERGLEEDIEIMKRVPEDDGLGLNLDLSLLERITVKTNEELTAELRQRIIDEVALMGYDITQDEGKILFFGDVETAEQDGVYVFVRLEKPYRNTIYKGVIKNGERYMSDSDYSGKILRELYFGIAFGLARQFVETVNLNGLSRQRVLRIKQHELLNKIDFYYCDMARLEAKREIEKKPELYNDGQGDNLDFSLLERLTVKC